MISNRYLENLFFKKRNQHLNKRTSQDVCSSTIASISTCDGSSHANKGKPFITLTTPHMYVTRLSWFMLQELVTNMMLLVVQHVKIIRLFRNPISQLLACWLKCNYARCARCSVVFFVLGFYKFSWLLNKKRIAAAGRQT